MSIHLPNVLLSIARYPITAVGLPLALGLYSGLSTSKIVRSLWYQGLQTPPGRPPREIFPLVWLVLYMSMGHASHLAVKAFDNSISSATRSDLSLGLALYYAQLSLNLAWSPLFFRGKKLGLAFADSVLMTGTTVYMTKLLNNSTNSETTFYLLPYCVWLTFVTYLSGGIWWLNRGRRQF